MKYVSDDRVRKEISDVPLISASDVNMIDEAITYVENAGKWLLNTDSAVAVGVPAGTSRFVRVKLRRAGPNTSEIMKTHSQTMQI